MHTRWRIQLFGALGAEQEGRLITRFRTQKTAALLAYLAFYCRRRHPREALIELLWPDYDLDAGRNSLSTALSSLRHQLEPPGVPAGAVIQADRASVGLNPAAVTTDVAEFEAALESAERAQGDTEREPWLQRAVDLYQGPLLSGFYEEWISAEQLRLGERYAQVLRELTACLERDGDLSRAPDYAHRAVEFDPLREEAHAVLMRLLAAAGQPSAALRQYRELERTLKAELDAAPSAATRQLIRQLISAGAPPSPPPWREQSPLPSPPRAAPPSPPPPPRASMSPGSNAGANLPLQLTRFFGREEEIARLLALLAPVQGGVQAFGRSGVQGGQTAGSERLNARLVTLTGPGGSGKTRLTVEAAGRLAEPFGGSVWFAPLADIPDASRIMGAIREALRLPPSSQVELLEQVVTVIAHRPALLVL